MIRVFLGISLIASILIACSQKSNIINQRNNFTKVNSMSQNLDTVYFGNGCFWCTEAIFQRIDGVKKVISGYSGGSVKNPTYKEVCSGQTRHAECLEIIYDKNIISYDNLLEIFWETHDPTTLNKQGNDIGTQYRSVVFYKTIDEKQIAELYRNKMDSALIFEKPIVTTFEKFEIFYSAEAYHQNYYNDNKEEGYCYYMIKPKVEKLEKVFADRLKK